MKNSMVSAILCDPSELLCGYLVPAEPAEYVIAITSRATEELREAKRKIEEG